MTTDDATNNEPTHTTLPLALFSALSLKMLTVHLVGCSSVPPMEFLSSKKCSVIPSISRQISYFWCCFLFSFSAERTKYVFMEKLRNTLKSNKSVRFPRKFPWFFYCFRLLQGIGFHQLKFYDVSSHKRVISWTNITHEEWADSPLFFLKDRNKN